MLKILVKKQMTEIFRSYFYDAKKNKARSKGATAAYFIFFILLMAGILGWVVAKISLKLKHKSLITVIVSLAFFGGYYFVVFKTQMLLSELLANTLVFGKAIKNAAYPLYLLGRVGVGDPVPCPSVVSPCSGRAGCSLGF